MTPFRARAAAALAAALLAGCESGPDERPAPPPPTVAPQTAPAGPARPAPPSAPSGEAAARTALDRLRTGREVFPHVRIDPERRLVEIDGSVPIDAHDPETPEVFLELIACLPDSREHESLVVTRAKASHVHAALLAIGAEPGRPGGFVPVEGGFRPLAPEGHPVDVRIGYLGPDGEPAEDPAAAWIVNVETGEPMGEAAWVFAGSRIVARRGESFYDADGAGNLVGLTTFGNEVVGFAEVVSPDSSVDEPRWIARTDRVPEVGAPVVLRLYVP